MLLVAISPAPFSSFHVDRTKKEEIEKKEKEEEEEDEETSFGQLTMRSEIQQHT